MLRYKKIVFGLTFLVVVLFTGCETEAIRSVGACSVDDWEGNYIGVEVCVGPDGMQTGEELTLNGTILVEANNVIDFSWVDNLGDAVQFLATLNDDDFCQTNSMAFPAGDRSFFIDIETVRMPDGNLEQTGAFFSDGFNFQTCTTIWTKQ